VFLLFNSLVVTFAIHHFFLFFSPLLILFYIFLQIFNSNIMPVSSFWRWIVCPQFLSWILPFPWKDSVVHSTSYSSHCFGITPTELFMFAQGGFHWSSGYNDWKDVPDFLQMFHLKFIATITAV